MKNKIEDLRNHLFATIEGPFNENKPLDIERTKVVAHMGPMTIEFTKVGVKALEIISSPDGSRSTFPQISREDLKQVFWSLRRRTPSRWSKGYLAV